LDAQARQIRSARERLPRVTGRRLFGAFSLLLLFAFVSCWEHVEPLTYTVVLLNGSKRMKMWAVGRLAALGSRGYAGLAVGMTLGDEELESRSRSWLQVAGVDSLSFLRAELRGSDPLRRAGAARVLSGMSREVATLALPELAACLQDNDSRVRASAARALYYTTIPEHLVPRIVSRLRDPSTDVIKAAGEALSRLSAETLWSNHAGELAEILRVGDSVARRFVIRVIERAGTQESSAARAGLIIASKADPDWYVRFTARRLLCGDTERAWGQSRWASK